MKREIENSENGDVHNGPASQDTELLWTDRDGR